MNCVQVFFTVLHVIWHLTFFLTNITAVVIGTENIEKSHVILSYWIFSYGITCLSYYSCALISAVITYVEGQNIDSQNTSLFQMIRIVQDELGMEAKDDIDFNEISINLSPVGQNRKTRRNILNIFFGLIILFGLTTGCIIIGMMHCSDSNFDMYIISYILIVMTCIKICIYIVYAVVQ